MKKVFTFKKKNTQPRPNTTQKTMPSKAAKHHKLNKAREFTTTPLSLYNIHKLLS
jgi:hypothetical protein